jgi:hypothetical protein
MTTGCNCPVCRTGLTPSPGKPCPECSLKSMPAGTTKAAAAIATRLLYGKPPEPEIEAGS